jgi:dTDP-4-amino-4,6-dideoxygalactose transaminase
VTPTVPRRIPLLDLRPQYNRIRQEVRTELMRVVDSQQFILGEDVQKFESEIAVYCGTRHAVGCASGSDALFLALLALDIRRGDEVLTTPYTFFATAGAVSRLGAVPVFADVEERTFNLDPARAAEVLRAHPKVRAIIPVHLFGGCADMDAIAVLAGGFEIPVVEDAAQSIGAECRQRRAGSIGRAGCFSFFPSKNLGGFGDGGMLTTDDTALAARLTALRIHGRTGKYLHRWAGINSRLDTLQAAVLRVKLRHLDGWTAGRQHHADLYRSLLAATPEVIPPAPAAWQNRHVYNQFVIRCPRRDALQEHLKQNGIGSEVYYSIPLHLQPCYTELGYRKGDFPVSERLAAESLGVPVYGDLATDDVEYICATIHRFYHA